MPLTTNNSLVTFRAAGSTVDVILKLTSGWTVGGGLDANVNTAEIRFSERAKLPTNLVYVSGAVYFWGSVDPESGDDPDVLLGNQWLVDCTAADIGFAPGDSVEKPLVYRLSFADHRQGFKPPRGGRLTWGVGNPEPLGDATLVDNSTLMEKCMQALGVSATVRPTVDDVAAKRQLEWLGAPAAAELGELLQHTGHVYCPQLGGGAEIWKLGDGEIPTVPTDRLIRDVTASSVSRLPRTVVFTSAPNAEARTYNQNAGDPPAWEYVVQDPANNHAWAAIGAVAALGGNPVQELARGFPTAAEQDRKLLDEQLYKVIRLKGDRYNRLQCPVLRDVLYPNGKVDQPHLVANVAVQGDGGGAWFNRNTRLNATAVDGATNLLSFDTRLGTVPNDGTADRDRNFTPLTITDVKPTFTVEDYNGTDGKRLSVFGFTLGVGVGAISEATARGKLRGYRPETAILDIPELRVVWLNDTTKNRDDLEELAESQATALLVEANNVRTIEVTGFFPCEIDGRINEVHFDQTGYRTTITIDGWSCATRGGDHAGGHGGHEGGAGGSVASSDDPRHQNGRSHHKARSRSRTNQIRQGGATARQPATPATPVPPAVTGFRLAVATVGNPMLGQSGRYNATTRTGKINRSPSGAYVIGDLGAAGTADDVTIQVPAHKPYGLVKGTNVVVLIGPTKAGTSTPIGLAIPLPPTFWVKVTKDGGSAGNATTAATWTYTVKSVDGQQMATAVPLYKTRPKGNLAFSVSDRLAQAFYDGNDLKLWDVDEVFGGATC